MSEDEVTSTNVRLNHVENNVNELKTDIKELSKTSSKENKAIADKQTALELSNVRMEVMFESIQKTTIYIKNSVIGFIVFCVCTYVYAQMSK